MMTPTLVIHPHKTKHFLEGRHCKSTVKSGVLNTHTTYPFQKKPNYSVPQQDMFTPFENIFLMV